MTRRPRRRTLYGLTYCLVLGLLCVFPSLAPAQDADRKVLKKVEPQYPTILKRRGIGGTVRLKVAVKADGSVKDVEVLGGNPALADAAEKAVRQWRFAPGNDSTITVAVTFDPNS
ncbi:MAG TPA: energy transducer TonB [Candidatus Acidoferrum sp.]|nr:energy transducer TonB [Candidatus Acidoferrum sp.]